MTTRTSERIRHHYDIERGLADRLRNAGPDERPGLYTELYTELFERVTDHPQVLESADPSIEQRRMLGQLRFLKRLVTKDTVYLELGPGVCSLARAVAAQVSQVFAVDVTDAVAGQKGFPENFELVLSDGTSVPVNQGSVDLAFSNQLMEHLHVDDALAQLENVYQALKPGGTYFCITPSSISGPHDVSRHYDKVATGFHLKEYRYQDLVPLFKAVGFKEFKGIVGYRGWGITLPLGPLLLLERFVEALPSSLSAAIARFPPIRLGLGVKLLAKK